MRFLIVLVTLSAAALVVAACGGGNGDGEPAATTATEPVVTATTTPPEATVEATVGSGLSAECEQLVQAYGNLSFNLQLANQLTSDEQYAALSVNGGSINLDVDALDGAVETLSGLPGVDGPISHMQEIAGLLRTNIESGTPFGDGSGNGQKLVDLVNDSFVDDLVAITVAVQDAGCTA